MKKPHLLLLITCIFAGFLSGFFIGRNLGRVPVQIRALPAATAGTEVTASAGTEAAQPEIVNINTATAAELQSLPGIGPVLAQRIIDYREANGPFRSVGELGMVSGIGEKKLEDIWDYVTTGGTS